MPWERLRSNSIIYLYIKIKKILIKNLVTEPVERDNKAKAELKLNKGKTNNFFKKIVKNSDKNNDIN